MGDLYVEADRILTLALAALAPYAPARHYVSPVPPVADCSQVTIHLNRIYFGGPGREGSASPTLQGPRTAEFVVMVLDCLPTVGSGGKAPTAAAEAAKAAILLDGVRDMYVALVADSVAQCNDRAVGSLTPVSDEGGVGGYAVSYSVPL